MNERFEEHPTVEAAIAAAEKALPPGTVFEIRYFFEADKLDHGRVANPNAGRRHLAWYVEDGMAQEPLGTQGPMPETEEQATPEAGYFPILGFGINARLKVPA